MEINSDKVARKARQLIDSAHAHLIAAQFDPTIKRANGFLYAAQAQAICELMLDQIDQRTPDFDRFSQLWHESAQEIALYHAGKREQVRSDQNQSAEAAHQTPASNMPKHRITHLPRDEKGQSWSRKRRLTEQQVREIRSYFQAKEPSYGQLTEVAEMYGVSRNTIVRVVEHQGTYK